jgi:hypothetical protein
VSIETMAIVLHHSRATGTAKLVLVGIANHAGDGGAWPSRYTLAKYAGCSEDNVRKAVKRLVGLGELRVHVQRGGMADDDDAWRPNRYDVLVVCPSDCDRTPQHRTTKDRERQAAMFRMRAAGPPVEKPPSETDGGVAQSDTPPAWATPKPSDYQPPPPPGSASTTGQARESNRDTTPSCRECSAPNLSTCVARQARVAKADRHTYTPRDRTTTP